MSEKKEGKSATNNEDSDVANGEDNENFGENITGLRVDILN